MRLQRLHTRGVVITTSLREPYLKQRHNISGQIKLHLFLFNIDVRGLDTKVLITPNSFLMHLLFS